MKKYLLLFLTVILAFSLVACKPGDDDEKTTSPNGGGPSSDNELFQGKTAEQWKEEYKDLIDIDADGNGVPDWQETEMTIKWGGRVMFDVLEENMVHRLALDWAKDYPLITIERDERFLNDAATGNDWFHLDVMVAASQDGSMPDLFVTYLLADYYDQGLTLDITPYLRTDSEARWISDNALWYMQSFDGKEYTGSVFAYFPDVIGVNIGLLEQHSIDIPPYDWDYEEYERVRSEVAAISTSRNLCLFPGFGNFLDTGGNYFDAIPGGNAGYNIETQRFELDKAPNWGEWQEQWISEIDQGLHFWDLTEQAREARCEGLYTWPWGDNFQVIESLNFWALNMDPQLLKNTRNMKYEVYPIPTAPEGGETNVFGWMDTMSMAYHLESDPVKAQAVYELLKFLTHSTEGKKTLYNYLWEDLERIGTSVEEFVDEKGGNAEDFPTMIYPGNTMMDYTFGWPVSRNPELLELHPFVVGFSPDDMSATSYEKMSAYNFEAFKLPYFQQQLSAGGTNIYRNLPGVNRAMDAAWIRHEILQLMRDEGYGWNDLAPSYAQNLNQVLDDYLARYNNVN